MKTLNVNVYQYHELNDKAKEKARAWYNGGQDFTFEWGNLKEDAKTIGLDLTAWDYGRYCRGHYVASPYAVIKAIKENHGECCDTFKTALQYEAQFAALGLDEDGQKIEEEDLDQDLLNALLEDYRVLADKEYEYTHTEEYIEDAMEANEYTFLEDGTRF